MKLINSLGARPLPVPARYRLPVLRRAFPTLASLAALMFWPFPPAAAQYGHFAPEAPAVASDLPEAVRSLGETLVALVRQSFPSTLARGGFEPFRQSVAEAVKAHPDVAGAAEQVEELGAASREAFAALLPQVSGSSDGGVRDIAASGWTGAPAQRRDGYSLGLTVRQLVWDFGATFADVDAARAREKAVLARLEGRQSEFGLRAIGSWFDLQRVRKLAQLNERNVASRREILNLVQERESVGGGTLADVIRARARYTDALALTTAIQTRLSAAEAGYQEVFGAPAPSDLGDLPPIPLFETDLQVMKALSERFPSLREAMAQVDAARQATAAAEKRSLPGIYLELSNQRRDIHSRVTPGTDKAAALVLRYNFYSGGAETARKDQARARQAQVELQLDSLVRQFERVLTEVSNDVKNGQGLQAAREDAARGAVASLRAVREQFSFNRGTLLDLMRAQEDLFNAGRELIDVTHDVHIARARLLHLTSGLSSAFGLPIVGDGGRASP